MSVRNLEALFAPRSVAVIGASTQPGKLGALVLRNLRAGGFEGPVSAVGLRAGEIDGLPIVAGVDALAHAPDLAIICTPAPTVPSLIAQLGRRGTRAAVVLTAGLKQRGEDGRTYEQAMLEAARPWLLRVLGPNCIGELVPALHLNASFAPGDARPGPLGFVTQSGALAAAMLDWAAARAIGFTHFVSLGDSADVDFGDMLDYLGSEARTQAILLYIESVRQARKFMSAARAAARNKPVVVVKAGRAPAGARAAASHTGALAGADDVIDAAIRRAGMLRVDTLESLFDAAELLGRRHPWQGERLAILTNGGGAGVLAADALALGGGTPAELSAATLQALDAVLPAGWPRANPIDIVGDAPVERYTHALRILLAAPEVDGVLFMHAPTAIVPAADIASACVPLLRGASKPVLAAWLGGVRVEPARQAFAAAGVPCFLTPEQAVQAWLRLAQYHANQQALLQLPANEPDLRIPDAAAAAALVAHAVRQGREWLDTGETAALLAAYGVPFVPTKVVQGVEQAVDAAAALGGPVALKVVSPQVLHKTDAGGVALDLAGSDAVRTAAHAMVATVKQRVPDAQVTGFVVQPMVRPRRARELIVGLATDPVFGPVVLFGAGGIAAEIERDRAVDLPPLNGALARAMVARTRVGALLRPHRGQPGVDEAALADVLLRVSQLACDLPEVVELDLNPLLAGPEGVIALDARVRVRAWSGARDGHLALRPYPRDLEARFTLGDRTLGLRPVRPDDGERLTAFYGEMSPEDLRLRFFFSQREVPSSQLARFCQVDYDREMAFLALDGGTVAGEVRAICDPDNRVAEFAILVAPGWRRRGLGRSLLERMAAYLAARGTAEMVGDCLMDNAAMAALARATGFRVADMPGGLHKLTRPLA
ncbi:bifunctional acetate--CoA ligase family protein/GNAT family N-acetyltransferase [Ramlibacter algicola]|uniref:Bifunctional acetate--CoA ligase family protein/GNAT family N-acetyltransferase n=1 Tax=Ramlibacter algicola TaxID=2795217 RepID=A0A934Q1G7_9BURK|nr:bifunctional acetate--CoA ligase family protein/GNAT family N-acetyltransferase [Ramlibacter algicola]MBK0392532.1 bifunctional acetate--CoA ligase family protein/GNAT family N-acetyltransferase [Ramlibacter algicola]